MKHPAGFTHTKKARCGITFLKVDRNVSYQQQATFSYVLPTSKIPLLDWTTIRVGYIAKYGWLASSLDSVARSLGNFLNNAQDKNVTAELDFTKLYQKSRFLRAIDWDAPKAATGTAKYPGCKKQILQKVKKEGKRS